MHALTGIVAASALCASLATAQTVLCDGNLNPDWDACNAIMAQFNGSPGYLEVPGSNNNFVTLSADTNCVLSVFWPRGTPGPLRVARASLYTDYQFLISNCRPQDAGGRVDGPPGGPDGPYSLATTNNPDYDPTAPPAAPGKIKRTHARGVNFTDVAAIPNSRAHARDLNFAKRQVDGDTGFTLFSTSIAVENGDRVPVTGRLPAGSRYTVTSSESRTQGISTTVEVGVSAFDIFSASVNIQISEDYTVSNEIGVNVNVDCTTGQEGVIFWVPLFTRYTGFFTPSNTNVEIFIPNDSVQSRTNYDVQCLG